MPKEELYEEIDVKESVTQRYLGLSIAKFLLFIGLVVGFGIYIGVLLYGNSSLQVLFGLDDYQNYLHTEIHTLKNKNADLQREYFELKEISAQ